MSRRTRREKTRRIKARKAAHRAAFIAGIDRLRAGLDEDFIDRATRQARERYERMIVNHCGRVPATVYYGSHPVAIHTTS